MHSEDKACEATMDEKSEPALHLAATCYLDTHVPFWLHSTRMRLYAHPDTRKPTNV